MDPRFSHVVADHLRDLRREADAERLARAALDVGNVTRHRSLQRLAGRSAHSLSRGFAALAARVDPIDVRPSMSRRSGA